MTAPTADPFARFQAAPATGTVPTTASPASGDMFGDPAPTAKAPRIPDCAGRLVLIRPIRIESVPKPAKFGGKGGEMIDRLTADLVVLDGGPLHYGGRPEARVPIPHDMVTAVPYVTRRRYMSQAAIAAKGRAVLENPNAPRWILGRIGLGEAKDADTNPPWVIEPATTDDERALARAWFAANPQDPFTS